MAPESFRPLATRAGSTRTLPADAETGGSRVFPCEGCGAWMEFHIGRQSLKCDFCGHIKPIVFDPSADVAEQDFRSVLRRVVEQRGERPRAAADLREVECRSCGAVVQFIGTITSTECAYCGVPLQLEHAHDAPDRVPVDGVLAFLVDRETARANLRKWVRSRWFAPNEFARRGVGGRFNGVYLPYWTFDTLTFTRYTGRRGEHYWVTVGSGKNRRRVRRTRWYPASGAFQRFFDDVLCIAGTGLPDRRIVALEPWPLHRCAPFKQEVLAGFLARTYDIPLDDGFIDARHRIDEALHADVRRRIGGDAQIVQSVNTRYDALTYKHLLLPVWMMAYRFRRKSFQVVVNAATGEVQGDRPYSWVKILLAVLASLAGAAGAAFVFSNMQ